MRAETRLVSGEADVIPIDSNFFRNREALSVRAHSHTNFRLRNDFLCSLYKERLKILLIIAILLIIVIEKGLARTLYINFY